MEAQQQEYTVLAIGDPHFKDNNALETGPMTEAVVAQAAACKPKFIVNLGDTLHDHNSLEQTVLNRAADFIKGLSQVAPTYVLIGNHDRINNQDFLSPVNPFPLCESPAIKIIWTTLVEKIGDYWFIFVPYVPKGRFIEALMYGNYSAMKLDIEGIDMERPWMSAKAIFCHQEFRGVKRGKSISIKGDIWPENAPVIIAGHYHDYQMPQLNIIYTGTPIQHDFDESEDKSISLFFIQPKSVNEQRLRLGLRLKKRVWITLDDVMTYQPTDKLTKIIIKDTTSRLKTALSSPTVKQWMSAGFIVGSEEIPEACNAVISLNQQTGMQAISESSGSASDNIANCFREPVNFSQIFFNALENEVQRSIFQQHFGSVTQAPAPYIAYNPVPLPMSPPQQQTMTNFQYTNDVAFNYM